MANSVEERPSGTGASTTVSGSTLPGPGEGYSGLHEKSDPLHSVLEHLAVLLLPLMAGVIIYLGLSELLRGLTGLQAWALFLLLPAAWLTADWVSGMAHWACDTYGSEDMPILGKTLIRPFRMHHLFPRDICTHNFVVTNGNSCIPMIFLLAGPLYVLLSDPAPGFWWSLGGAYGALSALALVATNQFHKWAHQEHIGPVVRGLQKIWLILPVYHHHKHHTPPHDTYYCITSGHLNFFLHKIRYWRALEAMLRMIGIPPAVDRYGHGEGQPEPGNIRAS